MLPDGISTVTVTGRFLTPEGTPLSGQVVFRAPALITLPDHDVVLGGPVTELLDAQGAFSVTLLATDTPGMNPADWSYTVTEQLAGVASNRSYQVLLPADVPTVDIADIAPADPTTPTYVPVPGPEGPEGPEGPAGTPGSRVYALSAPPPAGTGVAGDMAVRTDTGLVYQYVAGSGWVSQGSIRGPQGLQGLKGDKGDPGTVNSVNTKTGPDIVLTASDVGALALTGGTVTGATVIQPSTGHPLTAYSNDGVTNFRVTSDGHPYSNSTRATFYNVGVGDTGAPFGGGVRVLGLQNASTLPTTTPTNGVVAYSENGKLKVLQSDGTTVVPSDALTALTRGAVNGVASLDGTGKVPAAQLPAAAATRPGVWLPDDFGLSGWAYDLHANSPTPGDMPGQAQRLYFVGVPLRQAKTVTQIAVHVMGYDKPNSTITGAFFGIYSSTFAPLSRSADAKSQLPEVHNVGGQIAKITIPSVSLAAGFYYVAILVRGTTTASPYFGATNWTPVGSAPVTKETVSGAVGASTSGVHRWLQSSSTAYTNLTGIGTLTAASFAETTTCYWAAIV